jgi:NADH:ubiquinone oxidoreductase 27 kD subunit
MFGIDFTGFDDGTGLGLRPLLLPEGFDGTPLRKSFVLASRASKAWPGAKEPGEGAGGHDGAAASEKPGRRKINAPGVPDTTWGPR